jgi:hypothetical protein
MILENRHHSRKVVVSHTTIDMHPCLDHVSGMTG